MKRDSHETGGIPVGRQVYLFHGRTCVNPRSPYPSVRAATEGAQLRQHQSRQVGLEAVTYLVVENEEVVAIVQPRTTV